MVDFTYYNPAKIVFGRESVWQLNELLKEQKTTSLLLVYSGDFIKELGIHKKVADTCHELGIAFYENGEVVPNPSIELVRTLVSQGKKDKVDFVLAVGGGSSIDTAKAVALGIPYEGDVWDFFEKGVQPKHVLPVGVVTTLPASGSETSNCAILSNGLLKLGFEDNAIIPKFAIMNPEYTLGLPHYQTFSGIADILSHLLERYFSATKHTDVTDYLIEGGIKSLLINSKRLLQNQKDYDARAEIQWLASIAHNNLLDTGREADWGPHRIEHELSAQYGVTHGEGMAVVFTAWTKFAAKTKPEKLAQLSNRIYGIDYYNHSLEEMALLLSQNLQSLFASFGLKTTLTQLQIDRSDFDEMAKRATNGGKQTVGHYIPLNDTDFIKVLELAI